MQTEVAWTSWKKGRCRLCEDSTNNCNITIIWWWGNGFWQNAVCRASAESNILQDEMLFKKILVNVNVELYLLSGGVGGINFSGKKH